MIRIVVESAHFRHAGSLGETRTDLSRAPSSIAPDRFPRNHVPLQGEERRGSRRRLRLRTRHQAGGTGIQAAASESAAVAAGCAIGDHFGASRSQSSVWWGSAGGWSSSDRLFQPNCIETERSSEFLPQHSGCGAEKAKALCAFSYHDELTRIRPHRRPRHACTGRPDGSDGQARFDGDAPRRR